MKTLKIALIQPKYFNIWEAIGLGYIAGYCKKNYRGSLEINYFQGYFDNDQLILKSLKDVDIVGFSCTSPTFGGALALARKLKEINKKASTVFGGFHPTALAEDLLSLDEVDQIVTGEGEKAFLSILEGNRSKVIAGDPVDFNELRHPDREVIKNFREVDLCQKMIDKRITSFQSVRVCPFQCIFCAEKTITGKFDSKKNPIRERAPADLLDEIEIVSKKYRLDMFKFVDATWNTSTKKVIDFCKEKIKRGNRLEWECNVHAALTSDEMFYWMKEANCNQINVGCESGSPKILKAMRKGITVDKIRDVFNQAKKHRLGRRAFFSIGMPEEDSGDIRLTEGLIEDIRPDVVGVTILCPYPGTDLYDKERFSGIDWSNTDEYGNDFWRTNNLSNHELKYWQRYLTDKFKDNIAWHHKAIAR